MKSWSKWPNISKCCQIFLNAFSKVTKYKTKINFKFIEFKRRIFHTTLWCNQCDQKKSPNIYKSCPKTISLEKWLILTPSQKMLKNVGNLVKLIIAKGIKKLPKVQKIASQSGHTGCNIKLLYACEEALAGERVIKLSLWKIKFSSFSLL